MNLIKTDTHDIVIRIKKDLFVFRTKRGEWCKQTPECRRITYGSFQSLLDKNVRLQKDLKLIGLLYADK